MHEARGPEVGAAGAPTMGGNASGPSTGHLGLRRAPEALQGGAARPGGRRRLCLPSRVAAAPPAAAAAAGQGAQDGGAAGAAASLQAAHARASPAGKGAAEGTAAAPPGSGERRLQGVDRATALRPPRVEPGRWGLLGGTAQAARSLAAAGSRATDTDGVDPSPTSPLCSPHLQQLQAPGVAGDDQRGPRCPDPRAVAQPPGSPAALQAVQGELALPASPSWEGANDHDANVSAAQLPLAMRVSAAALAVRALDGAGSCARDGVATEVSASQLPLAMRIMSPAAGAQSPRAAAHSNAAEEVSASQLPLAMRITSPAPGAQSPRAAAHSSAAEEASASQLPLAMRAQLPAPAAHAQGEGIPTGGQACAANGRSSGCPSLPGAQQQPRPGARPPPPVRGAGAGHAEEHVKAAAGRADSGTADGGLQLSQVPLARRVPQPRPNQAAERGGQLPGTPEASRCGHMDVGLPAAAQLLQVPLVCNIPAAARQPGAEAAGRGPACDAGGPPPRSPLARRILHPAPTAGAGASEHGKAGPDVEGDTQPLQVPLARRAPASPPQPDAAAAGHGAGGAGVHVVPRVAGCRLSPAPTARARASEHGAAGLGSVGNMQLSVVPLACRIPAPQQGAEAPGRSCAGGAGMQASQMLLPHPERTARAGALEHGAAGPAENGSMHPAQALPLARHAPPAAPAHAAEPLRGVPGAERGTGHAAAACSERPRQAHAAFGTAYAGGAEGRPASGRTGAGRLGLGGARIRRPAAPSFDLLAGILTGPGSLIRPAGGVPAAPMQCPADSPAQHAAGRQGCLIRPEAGALVRAAAAQCPIDGAACDAACGADDCAAHGGRPSAALQGLGLRAGAAGFIGPPTASPAGREGPTLTQQARSYMPLHSPRDVGQDGSGISAPMRTPTAQGLLGDPWSRAGWPSGDDDWGDEQWGAAAAGSGLRGEQHAAEAAPAAAQHGQASTGTPLWQCGGKV